MGSSSRATSNRKATRTAARSSSPGRGGGSGNGGGGGEEELPAIHSERDSEQFVKKSLARAQRFQQQATKRRVFSQISEYMWGRGKDSMNALYVSMQDNKHDGGARPHRGEAGITRLDFKHFIKRTSLGATITEQDMDVAFDLADRDGSGVVSHGEFVDVFAPELRKQSPKHGLDITNAERLQVRSLTRLVSLLLNCWLCRCCCWLGCGVGSGGGGALVVVLPVLVSCVPSTPPRTIHRMLLNHTICCLSERCVAACAVVVVVTEVSLDDVK